MQLGRVDEARTAFDRAIALAHTPAEAAHIRMHLDRLMKDSELWKSNQKNSAGNVGLPRPRSSSV
jgi:RNA polymerase sigma-70 factor, ECF subfamily